MTLSSDKIRILFIKGIQTASSLIPYVLFTCLVVWLFIKGYTFHCDMKTSTQIITEKQCLALPKSLECKDKNTISYIAGNTFLFECIPSEPTIQYNNYTTSCLNICITPLNGSVAVETKYVAKTYYDTDLIILAYLMMILNVIALMLVCILLFCVVDKPEQTIYCRC